MYAQLLRENRELRKRLEALEDAVFKGKQNKKGVPKSSETQPPWEREGLTKKEWMKKAK